MVVYPAIISQFLSFLAHVVLQSDLSRILIAQGDTRAGFFHKYLKPTPIKYFKIFTRIHRHLQTSDQCENECHWRCFPTPSSWKGNKGINHQEEQTHFDRVGLNLTQVKNNRQVAIETDIS